MGFGVEAQVPIAFSRFDSCPAGSDYRRSADVPSAQLRLEFVMEWLLGAHRVLCGLWFLPLQFLPGRQELPVAYGALDADGRVE